MKIYPLCNNTRMKSFWTVLRKVENLENQSLVSISYHLSRFSVDHVRSLVTYIHIYLGDYVHSTGSGEIKEIRR